MAITTFQLTSSGSQEIVLGSGFNVDATDFVVQFEASSSWTGSINVKKTVYGGAAPFTSSYTKLNDNSVTNGAISSSAPAMTNQGIKVDGSGCTVILQHNRVGGSVVITASQVRSTGRVG